MNPNDKLTRKIAAEIQAEEDKTVTQRFNMDDEEEKERSIVTQIEERLDSTLDFLASRRFNADDEEEKEKEKLNEFARIMATWKFLKDNFHIGEKELTDDDLMELSRLMMIHGVMES